MVITTRFASDNAKQTAGAGYAHTNDAIDAAKDSFHNTHQVVTKDILSHNLICFASDFITKVGNDRSYCPEIHECEGIGKIKEKRSLLVDFALTIDLKIEGIIFAHKNKRLIYLALP
jgi:hypothetical protein